MEYTRGLAATITENYNLTNTHVVEVGCGKGDFLHLLASCVDESNRFTGFDTSYIPTHEASPKNVRFFQEYYKHGHESPGVILTRHVIEHIADPADFMRSLRRGLMPGGTKLYIETPSVDWILANGVFWDFFYEHCSLFSKRSLTRVTEQAGFDIAQVEAIFGDQYLWLEAVSAEGMNKARLPKDKNYELYEAALRYKALEAETLTNWQGVIREQRRAGKLAIWGAGAKGVTFANLMDPDQGIFDCVIDVNPNKQEKFLPGTGHLIISPDSIKSRNVKSIILMNKNYYSEVEIALTQRDIACTLL